MLPRPLRMPLLAAGIIGVVNSAQAATVGTLLLSGSFGLSCSLSIAPQGISTALNLDVAQNALLVARVTEVCNDMAGYKVTLDTQNGTTTGVLKGSGGNTDTIAYTVSYNGVAETFSGGSAQVTSVTSPTPPGGVSKPVAITYSSGAGLNPDTYTDTLTVTLTVN